ncbi:MAG: PAS domain-containing protein [Alphaproteobacteria bacterium]|jgi:PAS domain S-box|nr:PAS domain-containing protein [Alphaproteobacteria bacterium]MBU0795543.1 PAS domain-containing protein [Alphaproteobacteria bacterium]MBU0874654.1 PAS domain-containing protein [Alphaproteobacteria bacterium]MBU1770062.1 PAS domain-containing protein [Alphaproteobacteria bacterium]
MPINDIIDASSTAAVISNPRLPDNPIVACNDAFVRLTGYDRDEIIGRNCRFLRGAETEDELSEILRTAISKRQPAMVEITNYKKNGAAFRNAVMIAPMFDDDGELEYFLGSQMEVPVGARPAADDRRRIAAERIETLTGRQRQILLLMSAGKLNKQIAYELGLSERTIKMHRSALFRSLGVQTSADAIRLAVEAGY